MIIVLLTILLLVAAIVLTIIGYKRYRETDIDIVFGFCVLIFGIFMLIEISLIGVNHGLADKNRAEMLYEKEVLEYGLDENGLEGNELLYHDIVEFNNELRSAKYWYNNPWTNWFVSEKIASIEYIEIGKDK